MGSLPSLFINHISAAPLRVDTKAICLDPPIGVGNGVKVIVGVGDGEGVSLGNAVFVGDGVMNGVGVFDSISKMGTLVFIIVAVAGVRVGFIAGMA
jgi:hypothetical protein